MFNVKKEMIAHDNTFSQKKKKEMIAYEDSVKLLETAYCESRLPIFMAGGRVNWVINTKRNKGSEGRKPRVAAALTTQIPIAGSRTYRTKSTPMMTDGFILDKRRPI